MDYWSSPNRTDPFGLHLKLGYSKQAWAYLSADLGHIHLAQGNHSGAMRVLTAMIENASPTVGTYEEFETGPWNQLGTNKAPKRSWGGIPDMWFTSEVLNLLRDCLMLESSDEGGGMLSLFHAAPKLWRVGDALSMRDMPTRLGYVLSVETAWGTTQSSFKLTLAWAMSASMVEARIELHVGGCGAVVADVSNAGDGAGGVSACCEGGVAVLVVRGGARTVAVEVHHAKVTDDGAAVLRPQLTRVRTIAFSPLARLRDPTTALFDPVSKSWHLWCSYKPLNATHIYATNASIRHYVLRSTELTASGPGTDGTWEDHGNALMRSDEPGSFDSNAVYTPNAAVECRGMSCTWFLWHGGVSGDGPAKRNEEKIGLATAASPFGPFVRHGKDPVFTAEDSTVSWCGKGKAARVDFVVPLVLRGSRYLAVKAVCKNFTALPVMYTPADPSSWAPPYKPSTLEQLAYAALASPLVNSLTTTCGRAGFEKPAFAVGPDHNLHALGHDHGSCQQEGAHKYHHLYRSRNGSAWRYGGHFGAELPAHPWYEPVPVPRDGSGVMGDRPATGVPVYWVDFGNTAANPWHSNISLLKAIWVPAVPFKADDGGQAGSRLIGSSAASEPQGSTTRYMHNDVVLSETALSSQLVEHDMHRQAAALKADDSTDCHLPNATEENRRGTARPAVSAVRRSEQYRRHSALAGPSRTGR
jgi:hypothetical protein